MHFPWVNVILFALLFLQLITGYIGMTNGREAFQWVLWLHGIGAYGLVVLLYWKSNIILDALRRKNRWTWRRLMFIVMALLLLLTLGMGLIWTFNGPVYLWGYSLMSLHIYVAIPVIIMMVWHSRHMRFVLRLPETGGRRLFLHSSVTSLAGLLLWRTANWSKRSLQVLGANRRFTGSYEKGSFSGRFPRVSWILDYPDPIDLAQWQLVVDGAVKRPLTFTYEQLQQLASNTRAATLDCTGGWYTTQEWRGVNMDRLLEMAGVKENATSVTFRAISGYKRRFTLAETNTFLLALDVANAPLTHGHGAPARLVAVEKRGMEWVKWITHIHVNKSSKIWQSPLPLQ